MNLDQMVVLEAETKNKLLIYCIDGAACRMQLLLEVIFNLSNYCPHFTAQRYAKSGICRHRVSVCVSVTHWYCIKTAKCRITQIMSHDSPGTIVF